MPVSDIPFFIEFLVCLTVSNIVFSVFYLYASFFIYVSVSFVFDVVLVSISVLDAFVYVDVVSALSILTFSVTIGIGLFC